MTTTTIATTTVAKTPTTTATTTDLTYLFQFCIASLQFYAAVAPYIFYIMLRMQFVVVATICVCVFDFHAACIGVYLCVHTIYVCMCRRLQHKLQMWHQ